MPMTKGRTKGATRTISSLDGQGSAKADGALRGAIASLKTCRTTLLAERAAIEERLAAIEAALSAIGSQPRPSASTGDSLGTGDKSAFRAGSLKDYIQRVLAAGGVMSVKAITEAVLQAGYKTENKTLGKSVGIALAQMNNVVKVGRGQFKLA